MFIALFNSPKNSYKIVRTKLFNFLARKKTHLSSLNRVKVGSCFSDKEIKELAQLMRQYYSSCLWQKGDVLLIDNKKVMHAGMPGMGPRLVRAMICNPIEMNYSASEPGFLTAKDRTTDTIGIYMSRGKLVCDNELQLREQNEC
jgi:hypothetical protein